MLKLVPRQPRSSAPTARWTLSYFRPYRRTVALLGSLSLAEIALRAIAPWPMKTIIDHLGGSNRRAGYLIGIVALGLALQLGHQVVMLVHTRVQARLAQQMVFDLR